MINNIVLLSGVQQSDSVIHIPVSTLFQILFPFRNVTTYGFVEDWLTVEQLFLKCTVKQWKMSNFLHTRLLTSQTVLRIRQMIIHKP